MITVDELRAQIIARAPHEGPPPDVGQSPFAQLVADTKAATYDDLDARFRAIEATRRELEAAQAVIAGEIDERRAWAVDAHLNVHGWLRSTANWSTPQATRARQRARLFARAPVAGDAALDGRCGTAQIDELARAASNPRCGHEIVDVIDIFVNLAPKVSFDDFRLAVQR